MRVLILSSFTKSLLWFRVDLMDELVAAGHEVIALGSEDDHTYVSEFARHGVQYDSFSVSRTGLSPFEDLRTRRELERKIALIAPDKMFVYQAKTIVYGIPAARSAGVSEVYPLVAGLGSVFRSGGVKNRLIRALLSRQYKHAFSWSERVFFQNTDDADLFVSKGLVQAQQVVMINGSGVNIDHFVPTRLPSSPVFLFVGRLIRDKGIVEYLEAASQVKREYPEARFLVVGPFDSNPSALQPSELGPYVDSGDVEYRGECTDVRPLIAESAVLVLPSYHEGTPKSVLEAMAMGRAIITTDAPGCRETVRDGQNGLLVSPRSTQAVADAMLRLVREPELTASMGVESRAIAVDKYDVRKVNQTIMATMGLRMSGQVSVMPLVAVGEV